MSLLAIIGGTGVDLRGAGSPFSQAREEKVYTPWGSAHITRARLKAWKEGAEGAPGADDEREIIFLHRHADPSLLGGPPVPPHRINYRANIAALKVLGVTGILASTAVGSLRREWGPGTLVLLDQFIDLTSGRDKTFFDDRAIHIDVTEPYCGHLRTLLKRTAETLNFDLHDGGTYLCADGPRFETPAEIRAFATWGADVVGMTGVPEATLAREADLSYVGVSIVSNLASGISPTPLTQTEVLDAMKIALPRVVQLFIAAARDYEDDPSTPARNATREFYSDDFQPSAFFG